MYAAAPEGSVVLVPKSGASVSAEQFSMAAAMGGGGEDQE